MEKKREPEEEGRKGKNASASNGHVKGPKRANPKKGNYA